MFQNGKSYRKISPVSITYNFMSPFILMHQYLNCSFNYLYYTIHILYLYYLTTTYIQFLSLLQWFLTKGFDHL